MATEYLTQPIGTSLQTAERSDITHNQPSAQTTVMSHYELELSVLRWERAALRERVEQLENDIDHREDMLEQASEIIEQEQCHQDAIISRYEYLLANAKGAHDTADTEDVESSHSWPWNSVRRFIEIWPVG